MVARNSSSPFLLLQDSHVGAAGGSETTSSLTTLCMRFGHVVEIGSPSQAVYGKWSMHMHNLERLHGLLPVASSSRTYRIFFLDRMSRECSCGSSHSGGGV